MGNHVFVCYAREDEQFVLRLAGHLKAQGVLVWLDRWGIPGGANWQRSIDKAIQDCAKFLIVLSPAAVDSEEVEGELRTALDDQKPVVPVLYQPCRIPLRLRSRQYIDFTRGDRNIDDIRAQLVHDLGGKQAETVKPPLRPEPAPPPHRVSDKAPPQVQSEASPRSSAGRNMFWGAAIVLGLALGVWLFFPTAKKQVEPPVERSKNPETKETPSSQPPTVQPQTPPIAVSPPPSVDKAPSEDTKVVKDGKEMVRVSAGEFFMGCNEKVDKECDSDEKPGRIVDLPGFAIDKTEVTVADYKKCMDAGKCTQPGTGSLCNWGVSGRKNHPVNCVDWGQAAAYCKWVGKRLPTEAEWEKAARGTDGRKYPWGNTWDEKKANVGSSGTVPVDSYADVESPYGALNMAGNVWEWTADWYDEEHKDRSVRGGSWLTNPQYARVSSRYRVVPGPRVDDIGFRCAR